MNRTRLASLLCIVLGMLILTARFGTQQANLATPPSRFEATTIAEIAKSTVQARTIASPTIAPSPMATRAPQPTRPPRPTPMPEATATLSSATTEAATPPTDENTNDYYVELSGALQAITRSLDTLGQLAQHPQIDDATWQANIRAAIDTITVSRTSILAFQPPAGQEGLHATVLDAANTCGEAMDTLDAAIKTSNGSDLLAAATLGRNCAAKVQRVQEQIPIKTKDEGQRMNA